MKQNTTLTDYNFEQVESLVHLATIFIKDNNEIDGINRRIMLGHKTFYLALLVLETWPVLYLRSETWTGSINIF